MTTDNADLAKKIRALASYGAHERYHHIYQGCNSRLDEMQAAFLLRKLVHLEEWNEERKKIAKKYLENIANSRVILPKVDINDLKDHVFHIFPILCEERNKLQQYLEERGIGTNIHYPIPIPEQEAYVEQGWDMSQYSATQRICKGELSLPLYPGMSDAEVEYVIENVNEY